MPYKPRRTKSVQALQDSSNQKTLLDSDSEDDAPEKSSTRRRGKKTSSDAHPIITLPTGHTVRLLRRTDAPAVQEILNDPKVASAFPDLAYPQPFSLWAAYKMIDEILDEDGPWLRREYPIPDGGGEEARAQKSDEIYEHAEMVMKLTKVDARWDCLAEEATKTAAANKAAEAKSRRSSGKDAKAKAAPGDEPMPEPKKIPVSFGIASPEDKLIGLIDLTMKEPLRSPPSPGDPKSDGDGEYLDTLFMHSAELCYLLGKAHRGGGLMSALIPAFLDWAWQHFAYLETIGAAVYVTWNKPSARVLAKSGFVLEGRLSGEVRKQGRFGAMEHWTVFRPGGRVQSEHNAFGKSRMDEKGPWKDEVVKGGHTKE